MNQQKQVSTKVSFCFIWYRYRHNHQGQIRKNGKGNEMAKPVLLGQKTRQEKRQTKPTTPPPPPPPPPPPKKKHHQQKESLLLIEPLSVIMEGTEEAAAVTAEVDVTKEARQRSQARCSRPCSSNVPLEQVEQTIWPLCGQQHSEHTASRVTERTTGY